MNKKTAELLGRLETERFALGVRMSDLDDVFCAGNGSHELEAEYYAADSRIREIGRLIHEARQPKRNICRHTQSLVMNNID